MEGQANTPEQFVQFFRESAVKEGACCEGGFD